jgi:uncharacterized protein (TIGR03066 family)
MELLWFSRKHPRRRRPRVEAVEQEGAETQTAAPPAAAAPSWGSGRVWLFLLLCLAGSAVVSFVVFKSILVPPVPSELVGTWKVTEGKLKGATLEFRPDGKSVATLVNRGKAEVTYSMARVEGKKMFLTSRDDMTGKEETVTQTIVELTADELVIRDEDQVTYHLKRVGP